jgi:hypothetical protein
MISFEFSYKFESWRYGYVNIHHFHLIKTKKCITILPSLIVAKLVQIQRDRVPRRTPTSSCHIHYCSTASGQRSRCIDPKSAVRLSTTAELSGCSTLYPALWMLRYGGPWKSPGKQLCRLPPGFPDRRRSTDQPPMRIQTWCSSCGEDGRCAGL